MQEIERFELPTRPGCCALIYYCCGPLCALGFFLVGWPGFLTSLGACLFLALLLFLLKRTRPAQKCHRRLFKRIK